jgi:hypothetical protein
VHLVGFLFIVDIADARNHESEMKFDVHESVHRDVIIKATNKMQLQGDQKVFPWLQTFITRKLRGIQKEHMLKCTDVL